MDLELQDGGSPNSPWHTVVDKETGKTVAMIYGDTKEQVIERGELFIEALSRKRANYEGWQHG